MFTFFLSQSHVCLVCAAGELLLVEFCRTCKRPVRTDRPLDLTLSLTSALCCSFTRPQICGVKTFNSDKQFSSKRCLAWFHKYAGPDKVFGPEAMEKFCEDIGVEPENVSQSDASYVCWIERVCVLVLNEASVLLFQIIMLVLAWHLEAANMGYFTKDEWLRGMSLLQ